MNDTNVAEISDPPPPNDAAAAPSHFVADAAAPSSEPAVKPAEPEAKPAETIAIPQPPSLRKRTEAAAALESAAPPPAAQDGAIAEPIACPNVPDEATPAPRQTGEGPRVHEGADEPTLPAALRVLDRVLDSANRPFRWLDPELRQLLGVFAIAGMALALGSAVLLPFFRRGDDPAKLLRARAAEVRLATPDAVNHATAP